MTGPQKWAQGIKKKAEQQLQEDNMATPYQFYAAATVDLKTGKVSEAKILFARSEAEVAAAMSFEPSREKQFVCQNIGATVLVDLMPMVMNPGSGT